MNRSVFTNGVEGSADDLQFDSNTKAEEILKRTRDIAQVGIVTGLAVTVNAVDDTKIDIAAGGGYCGSSFVTTKDSTEYGEYISLSTGQTLSAPAGGWLVGTVYYVNLVYAETLGIPKPNEDGVTADDTQATVTPTLEIITQATYAALTDAQKQGRLRLAVITPSSAGIVANTDIEKPLSVKDVKDASQPVNITGVTIVEVSGDSTIGVGSLSFTYSGTTLQWKNPGDSAYGAAVNIGVGGTFNVFANDGIKFIEVSVVSGILPVANETDNITITSLYFKDVDIATADDRLHRSYIGSGTPTAKNPHGLALTDISGSEASQIQEHREVQHKNGIESSNANSLKASINYVVPTNDTLTILGLGISEFAYVYGQEITGLAAGLMVFSDLTDATNLDLVEVYLTDQGTFAKSVRAAYNPKFDGTQRDIFIVDVDESRSASGTLAFTSASPNMLTWDGGVAVAIANSGKYRLYAADGVGWVDVYVNTSNLPTVTGSETVTFPNAHISESIYLQICNVLYYPSTGHLIGQTGASDTSPVDKRIYGTMATVDLRDDILEYDKAFSKTLRDRKLLETRSNGVARGFACTITIGATTVTVGGGVCYINGKRIEKKSVVLSGFSTNGTYDVYIDEYGNITSAADPVTWIGGAQFLLVEQVVVTSSVISAYQDMREGVGLGSDSNVLESTGLRVDMPANRVDIDAGVVVGQDRCQSRWGDGVSGYSRIIQQGSMVYLTKNARWDGTAWHLDVSTLTGVMVSYAVGANSNTTVPSMVQYSAAGVDPAVFYVVYRFRPGAASTAVTELLLGTDDSGVQSTELSLLKGDGTTADLKCGAITGSSLNVGSGTITGGAITGSGTITGGELTAGSGMILGGGLNVSTGQVTCGSIAADGTAINITGHCLPNSTDAYNLGSSAAEWLNLYLKNNPIVSSDKKMKKNIEKIRYGLKEIQRLRPVSFKWRKGKDKEVHFGLVAQDVLKIVPEVVNKENKEKFALSYVELIPVLIQAVQELADRVDKFKNKK